MEKAQEKGADLYKKSSRPFSKIMGGFLKKDAELFSTTIMNAKKCRRDDCHTEKDLFSEKEELLTGNISWKGNL